MILIVNVLLGALVGVLLAAFLLFPLLFMSGRDLLTSGARLDISRVATRIQTHLLNGDFNCGEICHDILPQIVTYAQQTRCKLPIRFIPSERESVIIKQLGKEYELESTIDKELMDDLVSALARAHFFGTPFRFGMCILFAAVFVFYMSVWKLERKFQWQLVKLKAISLALANLYEQKTETLERSYTLSHATSPARRC